MLNKGVLLTIPYFTLLWFGLCAANMGAPPTLNIMGEVFTIIGLTTRYAPIAGAVAIVIFLAVVFTLLLYSFSQQGLNTFSAMCESPLSPKDLIVMGAHSLTPAILVFILAVI